jgi:hypothetical protein
MKYSKAIIQNLSYWGRYRNPCVVIKLPQSSLCIPRSSIFQEAGHHIGAILKRNNKNLNHEGANLLHNSVRAAGGSTLMAEYWGYCATERVADQIATQPTNWIEAITLHSIYSGSSGSSLADAA